MSARLVRTTRRASCFPLDYVGGFVSFPDGPLDFDVPVLGGTGSYSNARGFVHIRDLGNGGSGKSNNEFHLLP